MPSCVFKKCTNHSRKQNKSDGISFHSLPEDDYKKEVWLQIIRRQRQEHDWEPTKHTRVCSAHFKPADTYLTTKGLKRLTPGAVPYWQETEASSQVTETNPDSVFTQDTLREVFLKSKIKKITQDKTKLRIENKILKQKIGRLEKRCYLLKKTIIHLTKSSSK